MSYFSLFNRMTLKIKNHHDIHMIGYVHEKPNEHILVTKHGNAVPLRAQGWDHFKSGS